MVSSREMLLLIESLKRQSEASIFHEHLLPPILDISGLLQQVALLDDFGRLECDGISILINHGLPCTAFYHY